MEWTKEKLASKSPHERETIYKNAKKKSTPEAIALVKMIEEAGLPYSDTSCPTNDDPLTIAIYDVVHSAPGLRPLLMQSRKVFLRSRELIRYC